jgi:flagellar motor component MotA
MVVCAQEIDWMFEQEQERVYNKLILKLFSVSQTWRWKGKKSLSTKNKLSMPVLKQRFVF